MNIIFIAPPAAGKGTYSEMLMEKYGYNHISPGELFRTEVKNNTTLGNKVKEIMDKGELVNDDITSKIIENKLKTLDPSTPFILDGYPRTMNQIPYYEKILKNLNTDIDKVIFINIDKETGLNRKLSRLTCLNCGRGYNTLNPNLTPKTPNTCDECGSVLSRRTDDTKEAYEELYDIYTAQTMELIEYFKNQNKLIEVDGALPPNEVFKSIEKSLGVNSDN